MEQTLLLLLLIEGCAGSVSPEIPAGFSVGLAQLKGLQGWVTYAFVAKKAVTS